MGQNTNTWIDPLYFHYVEYKGLDGEEVNRCYEKLHKQLESLSRQQQNSVECAVNELCAILERIAFVDGVKVGGKLMLELTK